MKIESGSTTLYIEPIEDFAGDTRRLREIAAVAAIVKAVLGDDAMVTHDDEGAPHIHGYNISISHSRDLAVVALDRERRIGVDAEEIRPTLQRVKSRFLSEDEQIHFTTDEQLLAAWTVKEAVYKVVGSRAVEFATAINISPDMLSAEACGHRFTIEHYDIGLTHITLVSYKI